MGKMKLLKLDCRMLLAVQTSVGLLMYSRGYNLHLGRLQARSTGLLDLSIRPSLLSAAQAGSGGAAVKASTPGLKAGQAVTG